MGEGLSEDLRIRVIEAVGGGASRRAAAARFGVSVSSAVRRVREWRESGRTGPRRQGGDRLSGRVEAHADVLLAGIEAAPDRTLEELRALLLRERGVRVGNSTVWRFCDRWAIRRATGPSADGERLTAKKSPGTRPSRIATTSGRRAKPGSRPGPSSTPRG